MTKTSSVPKVKSTPHILEHKLAFQQPKRYRYQCWVICLCLDLLKHAAVTPRMGVRVLEVLQGYLPGLDRLPAHTTLRNWYHKWCYHLLEQQPSEAAGDREWCLIVDESISFAGLRLLLVVGVCLEDYDFALPLGFSDVRVLAVGIRSNGWKASQIAKFLRQQVLSDFNVAYVVSDKGANIIKAVKQLELPLVDDCGHAFACFLRSSYEKNVDFQAFEKACTLLKRKGAVSCYRAILPPAHRAHSRFMNVGLIIDWAKDKLNLLETDQGRCNNDKVLTAREREELSWLPDHSTIIKELDLTLHLFRTILSGLKAEGINQSTVRWGLKFLKQTSIKAIVRPRILTQIEAYLKKNMEVAQLMGKQSVICSSDLVESYFGCYKYRSRNANTRCAHFTTIVAYGRRINDCSTVCQALTGVTQRELEEWQRSKLDS